MRLLERISASTRARVTGLATLFVLLVLSLGSVVLVLALSHSISNSLINSAQQDAQSIVAQLKTGVSPAEAATTGRNDVVVQLLDAHGTVIASDHSARLTVPLLTSPGVHKSQVVPGEHDKFTVVALRAADEQGVRLVIVGRSTEQRDETRAEAAGVLAVSVPLTVAALAWIIWFSVGRALRPVEVMRQQANKINAAHLPDRLALPEGDDEIPRLARTLNEMLDRIEDGQRLQRQFVSDASHELRSPLAVIRQAAEISQSHPERISTEELAADVLAESARLEGLVSALLTLARIENRTDAPHEQVDLDDLVFTEVSRQRDKAGSVTLDVSDVGAGRTIGNPVLLAQVIRNLLDNAVRHASGVVRIGLHQGGGTATLVVEDDGSGIAAADRARVFERFVRLDEARARDDGGSGLGLAIVASIVHEHGGSVRIEDAADGGARFEVRLPMAPGDD
ncbi:sensor histidine kinase [Nocardioides marmorisolisilvae]|uniref:histidine kinase n=1 Tax=Nocardioides marmorisolisilvae TaxID=1542737 RepID=A0A3N0DTW9_9ACTN|nr:HAMP domain-containing sensor histidine kinase [Nocardioides marmorisolisilvae]RNL78961.1 sensor histidine kinase [Nocardioides marmorisolisilvae]